MALMFGVGLPVSKISAIDSKRVVSTTTPLAANATYTSDTFSTLDYARITGTVYANQAGTLYVEQSSDGTNFDSSSSFPVSAESSFGFSVEVVAPYARIRYVNGATAQTAFRLYAYLRVL